MRSIHTEFRLALEKERLLRLGEAWLEAWAAKQDTVAIDLRIKECERATRRTESYLRRRNR